MKKALIVLWLGVIYLLAASCSRESGLESRVDTLEKVTIENLREQINSVKNSLNSIQQNQTTLSNDMSSINTESTRVSQLVNDLNNTVKDIQNRVDQTSTDLKAWVSSAYVTKTMFESLQSSYESLSNELLKLSGLDEKVASMNQKIETCISDISSIKDTLSRIENEMENLTKQIQALISSVQSIIIIPDYSDGSVILNNSEESSITVEVLPIATANKLQQIGLSVFSLDYVETITKSTEDFHTIPLTNSAFDGQKIILYANGTKVSDAIKNKEKTAMLRLRIKEGLTDKSSNFYPVDYQFDYCVTGECVSVNQHSATLSCSAASSVSSQIGFYVSTNENPTEENSLGFNAAAVSSGSEKYTAAVDGLLSETTYYYKAYLKDSKKTISGNVRSFTTTEYTSVDFGLSVRWAQYNLGADAIDNPGKFYAWGDTQDKDSFTQDNYVGPGEDTFLIPADKDIATLTMGSDWRIPTHEEINELLMQCDIATVDNYQGTGVGGYLLTAKDNKYTGTLFFPNTGKKLGKDLSEIDGSFFWASDVSYCAHLYDGIGEYINRRVSVSEISYTGLPVRPVKGPRKEDVKLVLSKSECVMEVGEMTSIKASIMPANAYITEGLIWEMEDPSIATVRYTQETEFDLVFQALKPGQTNLVVSTQIPFRAYTAKCKIIVYEDDKTKKPEAIDLGLSVKWGSFNLGASAPQRRGSLFRWGEIEEYNPELIYKWGSDTYLTKYNYLPEYGECDYLAILQPEDDAATVLLGEDWHIPTSKEWQELFDNTEKTYIEDYEGTGVPGFQLTSRVEGYKDKSIFFPTSQYDEPYLYMGSTLRSPTPLINSGVVGWGTSYGYGGNDRIRGQMIRPVKGDRVYVPLSSVENIHPSKVRLWNVAYYRTRISPSNATVPDLITTVDDDNVALTSELIMPKKVGLSTIKTISIDGGVKAIETPIQVLDMDFSHDYVDMGLGVKWATCNLGACSPEESGAFYCWGEMSPRSAFDKISKYNYAYWDSNTQQYTKYYSNSGFLEEIDDPVRKELGEGWRMPTYEEISKLAQYCKWDYVEDYNNTHVSGCVVTSNVNGNSIFFPESGGNHDGFLMYGIYFWCNKLYGISQDVPWARILVCDESTEYKPKSGWSPVFFANTIRPVYEK